MISRRRWSCQGQYYQDFPSLPEPGVRPARTKRTPNRLGNWASEEEVRAHTRESFGDLSQGDNGIPKTDDI